MLGKYLKQQRLKKNLTQKQMALKVGISLSYYIQIERGQRKPGINAINKLAFAFDVEPSLLRNLL